MTMAINEISSRMNILCYAVGALNMQKDIYELNNGVHAIVGTPDSICGLIRFNTIDTRKIKICVLENPSFISLRALIDQLNSNTQFVSLLSFLNQLKLEHLRLLLKNPLLLTKTNESILKIATQCYVSVLGDDMKFNTFCELRRILQIRAIVFCDTDQRASEIMKNLQDRCFSVCFITQEMSAEKKNSAICDFCSGDINILITNKVLEKCIFQQPLIVINYDLPAKRKKYASKIIAAYRYMSKELVINFVSKKEKPRLRKIENYYDFKMEEISINNGTVYLKDKRNDGIPDLKSKQKGNDTKSKIKRSQKKYAKRSNHNLPTSNENSTTPKFEDLNLREKLAQRMKFHGLIKTKPLQQQALPLCLNGHDVIIQGPPGSGKKTTFSIAVLQTTDTSSKHCQVLVLVPNGKMVGKVLNVLTSLGADLDIKCRSRVNKLKDNTAKMKMDPHIIVGTINRILGVIRGNVLKTEHIKMLVIVDACEAFSSADVEQTCDIFKMLNSDIQVIVLSLNAPPEPLKKLLKNPSYTVKNYSESSLENVKQFYILVGRNELKFEILLRLYRTFALESVITFCNSMASATWLATQMQNRGMPAFVLRSGLSQRNMNRKMRVFRSVKNLTLIITDIFIGSELNGVSTVINYDLPSLKENYIRRLGSCGPNDNITAISLVMDDEEGAIKKIEKVFEIKVSEGQIEA